MGRWLETMTSGVMTRSTNEPVVEAGEIGHVERQEDATFLDRPFELGLIALSEASRLWGRDSIETLATQLGGDRGIDVLIGEEPHRGHYGGSSREGLP